MIPETQVHDTAGFGRLGSSLRSPISIIFGVETIETFDAIENDSEYVIAPQIPGRLLDGFSWSFPRPNDQQAAVGLCFEGKDVRNRSRPPDSMVSEGRRALAFRRAVLVFVSGQFCPGRTIVIMAEREGFEEKAAPLCL